MKAHFKAPTPTFGRANKRKGLLYQQCSPYYWWWAYLRRNKAYLECCAAVGKGDLSRLYSDFGDVREDDFHKWWTEGDRGARLFAEPPLDIKFGEIATATQWDTNWTADAVMLVAVPLQMSKRQLKSLFSKLLDERHNGKQGRPAIAKQTTAAKYHLARNYSIPNFDTTLAVYDLWFDNQQRTDKDKLKLWEIGIKLNLNKLSAVSAVSAASIDRLEGRNVLAATVSRYIKQAKLIIANTTEGVFP